MQPRIIKITRKYLRSRATYKTGNFTRYKFTEVEIASNREIGKSTHACGVWTKGFLAEVGGCDCYKVKKFS